MENRMENIDELYNAEKMGRLEEDKKHNALARKVRCLEMALEMPFRNVVEVLENARAFHSFLEEK